MDAEKIKNQLGRRGIPIEVKESLRLLHYNLDPDVKKIAPFVNGKFLGDLLRLDKALDIRGVDLKFDFNYHALTDPQELAEQLKQFEPFYAVKHSDSSDRWYVTRHALWAWLRKRHETQSSGKGANCPQCDSKKIIKNIVKGGKFYGYEHCNINAWAEALSNGGINKHFSHQLVEFIEKTSEDRAAARFADQTFLAETVCNFDNCPAHLKGRRIAAVTRKYYLSGVIDKDALTGFLTTHFPPNYMVDGADLERLPDGFYERLGRIAEKTEKLLNERLCY